MKFEEAVAKLLDKSASIVKRREWGALVMSLGAYNTLVCYCPKQFAATLPLFAEDVAADDWEIVE